MSYEKQNASKEEETNIFKRRYDILKIYDDMELIK